MKKLTMDGLGMGLVAVLLTGGAGCMNGTIELEHLTGGTAGMRPTYGSYGSGGAAPAAPSGGAGGAAGVVTASGGSRPGDPCDGTCAEGFECLQPASFEQGVCAPVCPGGFMESGYPCDNSVVSGPGLCVPFSKNIGVPGWPVVTSVPVCSVTCDPLLQDCPEHFACDLTDGSQPLGETVGWIFACLPIVEPVPVGEGGACYGGAAGACERGLTCVPEGYLIAACEKLCDTTEPATCSASQRCRKPDWFPAGTIGVCSPS